MVPKIEHGQDMTFAEAQKAFQEIQEAVHGVQAKYSGFFSRFRRNMDAQDIEVMGECISSLLTLSSNPCLRQDAQSQVQGIEDLDDYRRKADETLYSRVPVFLTDISFYLSRFKNTGVKFLGYCSGLE